VPDLPKYMPPLNILPVTGTVSFAGYDLANVGIITAAEVRVGALVLLGSGSAYVLKVEDDELFLIEVKTGKKISLKKIFRETEKRLYVFPPFYYR